MSQERDNLIAVARPPPMTREEAQRIAIERGALRPQGIREGIAANINNYNGGLWRDTPLAQARLEAWTDQIYNEANSGSGGR